MTKRTAGGAGLETEDGRYEVPSQPKATKTAGGYQR